jgi:hypothetical protein
VVDVVELMLGQSKRASDVQLAASAKLLSASETVIAHVVAMRAEEVAEPTAEAAAAATPVAGAPAAEPEVIKKGKKDEEAPAEEKGKKK